MHQSIVGVALKHLASNQDARRYDVIIPSMGKKGLFAKCPLIQGL